MIEKVDLTKLSDDTLAFMCQWWRKRLYARGGSWLAAITTEAAEMARWKRLAPSSGGAKWTHNIHQTLILRG